ncbi:MAG: S-adenosylmethionine:tRNA ribosyltransferase-isomerase, partial [Candidatus Zixiibacteriota bacterium]
MDISLFDYDLPPELIAQFPSRRRDRSRLCVLDRSTGRVEHRRFADIGDYLRPGYALVVNNTRVFKARLTGRRVSGAEVEIFLVRALDEAALSWLALARPTRRLKAGERIRFGDDSVILERHRGEGVWEVLFPGKMVRKRIISTYGHVPLPQYIHRADVPSDLRRYQTVYAAKEKTGAVAAPTAGFHFTRSLLTNLQSKGIHVLEVTLHVGPGTFKPVSVQRIEDH